MAGQIIVFRQDGLGARLRNMVLGLRMQAMFGCNLKVPWPLSRNTRELRRPQRLFGAEFVSEHLILGQDGIDEIREGAVDLSEFEGIAALATHLDAGGSVEIRDIGTRIALPGEDPADAHRDYMAKAAQVPLHPRVRRRLEAFDRFAGGQPVIALHVRRGDIIFDPYWARRFWPTKYVPDEYYDVMIEANPNARYLLFSDTAEAVTRFRDRHDIRSAAEVLGLEQVHQGQADLCELLAISRCKSVICGSYSAFSTAATLIGGADKTALPDDMPEGLQRAAEDRLLDRIGGGAENFINANDFGQSAHWAANALTARGDTGGVRDLLDRTVRDRIWIPHLSGETLGNAIAADADETVLSLIEVDQIHQVFPVSYLRKPPEIKRKTHQLFASALALAGSGAQGEAVRVMALLVFLQQRPGPLDVLSRRLAEPLAAGDHGCPPTTLIPYGPDQPAPGGLQHLRDQRDHILSRFLQGQRAFNWQAAMMLDWADLSMTGGFSPRPAALKHILTAGQAGSVMERSLAALCALHTGRERLAEELIDGCESGRAGLTDVDVALLEKRRAQVLLARQDTQAAADAMQRALDCSDHPAFATWWAVQEARSGDKKEAAERLAAIEGEAQTTLFQRLALATDAEEQAALKERFEAGFLLRLGARSAPAAA